MNKNHMWKIGTISVSPFDWLEASYFYYRPSDLEWLGNDPGLYLDKGFNAKFTYRPNNRKLPNLSIGLDDLAGTGFFSREYIVATSRVENTKVSLGIGWGKFVGSNSFKNPLSNINEKFSFRPLGEGAIGEPTLNKWFRGDASLFGGLEYIVPKLRTLKIKLEYDPFNYFDFSANYRDEAKYNLRKKNSNFNIGMNYQYNENVSFDFGFIKGNTINLGLTYKRTFNDNLSSKPKFQPKISKNNAIPKRTFYEDLLVNLNSNSLLLQTASLNEDQTLEINISTSEHRNAIRSSSYAAYIAKQVSDNNGINVSEIKVSHINVGVELNNVSYIANHLSEDTKSVIELKKRYTEFDSGQVNKYKQAKFRPNVDFPVIFSNTSPSVVTHIGNPEKFYYGGINITNTTEVQFSRNLLLSSELEYSIYNDIQDTVSGPGSKMQHVRTDLVQYLKEDDLYISRLQLDYIWSPYKDMYTKISGGIFETMYAGIGFEGIYKPFKSNFAIGAEIFSVRQRAFNQKFQFRDYKTTTGHINLTYQFFKGIELNLSYGRYLAKDDGFTFDLSRNTSSGFKSGIYFTRTDVPAEIFGEGSFDKGFYFQIPLDLFSNKYSGNYSTFKLSPLTRDGGAKLVHDKNLKGLIFNSTYSELNSQWGGFLN
jgi:hypothetical protein